MMMGNVLSALGRPGEAVKALRRALELVPGNSDVLGNLGISLMGLHQYEEAEQVLRQAQAAHEKYISDHPDVPEIQDSLAQCRLTLGTLFQQTGRVREAEEAFKRSLAASEKLVAEVPTKPDFRLSCGRALLALGELQANDGRAQEAERSFRRAIAVYQEISAQAPGYQRHRSGQFRAHMRLGNLLVKLGRAEEAKEAFNHAQEILGQSPSDPILQNGLAWILATCPVHQVRDPVRAVELARKVVEELPQNGTTWNTLGVALYCAGDWKAVVEALRKSMQLRKGGDSNDFFFLAMTHWRLGDRAQARTWYDYAVEWMDKNQPRNVELMRFRAEAAALLDVRELPDDVFARP
jgi:tetratricopeptide (TPR) repeat protein